MQEAQHKIKAIVHNYKILFPEEYKAVVRIVKDKKDAQKTRTGDVKGTDYLDRQLFEWPETLWAMFQKNLQPQELLYFTSKPGARWFVKTYREFALVEKV